VRSWLVAARPATLLASVAPVLVGTGIAVGDDAFRPIVFTVTLATAVALNLAANLANDASDAVRGADSPARIGPPRAVAGGLLTAAQVWRATAITLVAAVAGGIYLTFEAGWVVIAIGVTSIAALLTYTGGPRPYGYRGFGELSVFVFFGPAAVVGSRFVHDGQAPAAAWILAVPVGLLAAAILTANNVRDIDSDRTAAKRTLAVLLGRDHARRLYAALLIGAFAVIAICGAIGWTPRPTLMALTAVPLGAGPIRGVLHETAGPPLVAALKATARLLLIVGVLLAVGAAI
jgi:1,4-dihydroxy-2-naphthoate octaprenyltransferase